MDDHIQVQPLPYKSRQRTFSLLVLVFLVTLPFLYLYATGYRFDFEKPTNLVSTGGIYIAVELTGAEIYIDNELVRSTRTFRKALYAQNLDVGTHRVHVQKEGYHTWVKELPVSERLVSEAEAFNFPIVPQVRVISEWESATGSAIVRTSLLNASSTNELISTTTKKTNAFVQNEEYKTLMLNFATTSSDALRDSTTDKATTINIEIASTESESTTTESATTTIISSGVRLGEMGGELYATWIGAFEEMPYYYCAPEFPRYSTTTASTTRLVDEAETHPAGVIIPVQVGVVTHPVQTIPADVECEPTIRMDRNGKQILAFDFFPGSSDLVLILLDDGLYVEEIDDRAWQNIQPLFLGQNLQVYVEGANIYVYDDTLIYQIITQVS